jgi:hypothetical protein
LRLPQRLVAHPNLSVSVQGALIYLNNARESAWAASNAHSITAHEGLLRVEPGRSIARARMTAIGAERKSITRSRASAQRRLRTSKLPLFDF